MYRYQEWYSTSWSTYVPFYFILKKTMHTNKNPAKIKEFTKNGKENNTRVYESQLIKSFFYHCNTHISISFSIIFQWKIRPPWPYYYINKNMTPDYITVFLLTRTIVYIRTYRTSVVSFPRSCGSGNVLLLCVSEYLQKIIRGNFWYDIFKWNRIKTLKKIRVMILAYRTVRCITIHYRC